MSGDMADFALDQVMDEEDLRLDFRLGLLSSQEAYDNGIIDELGFEGGKGSPFKVCKHCGQTDLVWGKSNGKWRLCHYSSGNVHTCKEHTFD